LKIAASIVCSCTAAIAGGAGGLQTGILMSNRGS
jgi:hypothetical protein